MCQCIAGVQTRLCCFPVTSDCWQKHHRSLWPQLVLLKPNSHICSENCKERLQEKCCWFTEWKMEELFWASRVQKVPFIVCIVVKWQVEHLQGSKLSRLNHLYKRCMGHSFKNVFMIHWPVLVSSLSNFGSINYDFFHWERPVWASVQVTQH